MIISYNKWSINLRPSRNLIRWLHHRFSWVMAAGGVVVNSRGERLLIVRNKWFDLPKGMAENGESRRQTALREVQEETGLQQIEAGPLLMKTYHIYNKYGGWHLKQTSWYLMRCSVDSPTLPQSEEGITEVLWLPSHQWNKKLSHSYASLKLLTKISLH